MKLDDTLQTITHFFNDIIGALIPGLILATGLVMIHKGMPTDAELKNLTSNGYFITIIFVLSFAAGHGLLAIYKEIFLRALKVCRIVKGDAVVEELEKKQSFSLFKTMVTDKIDNNTICKTNNIKLSWDFNGLRNMVFSISSEGASLGRRFMFISLLCNGIGTALILLTIDFLVCLVLMPNALIQYANALHPAWQLSMLIVSGLFCFRRGDEFYMRALSTPFDIVIAELLIKES